MRTKEQTYFPSLWKKVYYVVLLGRQNSSLLCSASLRPIIQIGAANCWGKPDKMLGGLELYPYPQNQTPV